MTELVVTDAPGWVKPWLSGWLNVLPFVRWDRLTTTESWDPVLVYGWIAREDGRADFVLLNLSAPGEDGRSLVGYTTSSAKHDMEIRAALGLADDGKHYPCQRVEDHVVEWLENVIRLE